MYYRAPFRLRVMPSGLFEIGKIQPAVRRSRILCGELFADIIEDRRQVPPVVFCVVQQHGSAEVLFLGQFHTALEAEAEAHKFISEQLQRRAHTTAE